MSTTQQYKEYNKRLKRDNNDLKKIIIKQGHRIKTIGMMSGRDAVIMGNLRNEILKARRQLKQSKKWYQIILK